MVVDVIEAADAAAADPSQALAGFAQLLLAGPVQSQRCLNKVLLVMHATNSAM